MQRAIADRIKSISAARTQGQELRFVPILGRSYVQPQYELLRPETTSLVQVTETSEHGNVPELRVENKLDVDVFLMDGQELVGAKQNRILNTDVLVAARSVVKIPVSCVEKGRWRFNSRTFSSGKWASHRIRSKKLARVHENLKTQGTHDADQHAVWDEVDQSLKQSATASQTGALSDAYAKREEDLGWHRRRLELPAEAVGVAVFHGGNFQGLDLFDRHATLQYFWDSLVDSYAIDLLEAPVDPAAPASDEAQVIRSVLDDCAAGQWESFDPPGKGKEWRLQTSKLAAASLVWNDEVVIHLQVFPSDEAVAGR